MQDTPKLTAAVRALTGTTSSADTFLSEDETAQFLNVSVRTLQRWRQDGRFGPPFYRFGGLVRYGMRRLETWADEQQRTSTSDKASA